MQSKFILPNTHLNIHYSMHTKMSAYCNQLIGFVHLAEYEVY